MVNRLWQHHFGEGLVRSVDNFGVLGEKPTHPELLDWLADGIHGGREGWSIKKMHRLLLLSRAYQMASRADDRAAEERDPQNKLLHRMPIRRLEAEAVRDSILAVSGRLDPKMYGPSVHAALDAAHGGPRSAGPFRPARRRRPPQHLPRRPPQFPDADVPGVRLSVPFTTMGRRSVSNVPAQALTLLNNPFVVQQAELWAKRVLAKPGRTAKRTHRGNVPDRVRPTATESELADSLKFLRGAGQGGRSTRLGGFVSCVDEREGVHFHQLRRLEAESRTRNFTHALPPLSRFTTDPPPDACGMRQWVRVRWPWKDC